MHIHFLDPYRPQASPVHALDGRPKFVLTVAFILTTSLAPFGAWPMYVFLLALLLSLDVVSRLGVGYVLKRANLALPFVLAALPLVFTVEGGPLFAVHLGPWLLTASVEGVERFASVAFRSWLSVQASILLAATTPFPDLMRAMRSVGLPRLIIVMFGLMWRYLFVLVDEALRLMRARAARSGVKATDDFASQWRRVGGALGWRARVTGGMAGSLFLRAFERSDRIYAAMLSRGYDGEVRTLSAPALTAGDWAVMVSGLALLGLLLSLAFLPWG
ncbi:MAG: cobalt ECF transporter T component CbiQ [Chloroflexota bacterium]